MAEGRDRGEHRPIAIVSECPAGVEGTDALMDRKFHLGMLQYRSRLERPLRVIVPRADQHNLSESLEHERIGIDDLPYELVAIECDPSRRPLPSELPRVEEAVRSSLLVYGHGMGAFRAARMSGVPHIFVVEHDLLNAMAVARMSAPDPLRRIIWQGRAFARFAHLVEDIRKAERLHCNGYTAYDGLAWLQSKRLLYFDSRLTRDMVVKESDLERRHTSTAEEHPVQLVFSGRFERIKGAMDVVLVGIEMLKRGVPFELHLYGDGSLTEAMRYRIARHPGARARIHLHGVVPFEELQRRSKDMDLFVLCHRQGDPSCTYLEAMGCGLPIVGFENPMWTPLARDSEAGVVVAGRSVSGLCDAIVELSADRRRRVQLARRARAFASAHCFEDEFEKRSDDIAVLASRVR
jgi:glycosyltransferase involved in cell wall biosynthesis